MLVAGCDTGLDFGRGDGGAAATTGIPDPGSEGEDGGADTGEATDDPGRVTLHRLDHAEYDNTMCDPFWGLDVSPAEFFPADDHSFGFDDIADVLSVTPLLFELYEHGVDAPTYGDEGTGPLGGLG